jgi:hypothetical protein
LTSVTSRESVEMVYCRLNRKVCSASSPKV